VECQKNSGAGIRGGELTRIIRPIAARDVLRTQDAPVLTVRQKPCIRRSILKGVAYILS
jgi:mannose-6-phosphate isomerase class I